MVFLFKKVLSTAGLIFVLGYSVHAQDNVILKNGTELQVKVLEVSASQIKYKKQDNPDGPVYIYTIKDVLLIKYANGTKDTFGKSASALSVTGTGTDLNVNSVDQLTYRRGFLGSQFTNQQGTRLSGDETKSILMVTPHAYDAYQRGKTLRIGGYITSVAGLGLIGAGLGLAVLAGDGGSRGDHHGENVADPENNDNYGREHGWGHHNNGDLKDVGFAIAGAGILTGLVGVWLDHRATVQFRRASDRFNTSRPASLHFGPSRKGLGLGLAFSF